MSAGGVLRRLVPVAGAIALAIMPVLAPAYPLDPAKAQASEAANASSVSDNSTSASPETKDTQRKDASQGGVANSASAKPANEDTLTQSIKVLLQLFVLAVILESALAVFFQWRPYIRRFDGKTLNPLLAFVAALILVRSFNIDQVGKLIDDYNGAIAPDAANTWSTVILTALVVAGGSAGVNRMLRALGYRSQMTEDDHPRPSRNEAWIAVIDESRRAVAETYDILIKGANDWTVVGIISNGLPHAGPLQWVLRDTRRFPTSGGFSVPIDTPIEIAIQDRLANGDPFTIWGPHSLGAGAVIDVRVRLDMLAKKD